MNYNLLQEFWQFKFELNLILTIHPDLSQMALLQLMNEMRLLMVDHLEV